MEQLGRYRILGELGRGAMGVVYRAQDPAIGRPVAIKTIRLADFADAAERERLRERLFREAQAAGILSHPGIVAVYDVAEEDGIAYIAMEFVNGTSLEKVLASGPPPEPEAILNVLRQTAAALDYAHKKGIVHRDIKPANIMLDEDRAVKIADFGVAKISRSEKMTQAGTVLGTPNYMAPEQVQGRDVDGRVDQWGLAVIAYEILTGEKPFAGEQLTTVLYKIVSENPAAPQNLNTSLGWAAGVVLGKALSKNPAERYGTCTEFVNALEKALATKKGWKALPHGASENLPTAVVSRTAAARAMAVPPRPPAPPVPTPGWTREPEPARSKRRGLLLGFLAAVAGGLAVAAVLFVAAQDWFGREERAPQKQAEAQQPPPQPKFSRPAPMPPPAGAPQTAPATPEGQPQATAPVQQPAPAESQPAPAPQPEAAPSEAKPAAPEKPPEANPPEAKPAAPAAAARQERRSPEPARRQPALPPRPVEPQPVQLVTSPPGAQAIFDSNAANACKTPCTVRLSPGRHTVSVTLPGYQRELRIIEVTGQPMEQFVGLQETTGTLRIESAQPGATIIINGQQRRERTPATLTLPAGRYHLIVVHNGRRAEQDIEVKDNTLVSVRFEL